MGDFYGNNNKAFFLFYSLRHPYERRKRPFASFGESTLGGVVEIETFSLKYLEFFLVCLRRLRWRRRFSVVTLLRA